MLQYITLSNIALFITCIGLLIGIASKVVKASKTGSFSLYSLLLIIADELIESIPSPGKLSDYSSNLPKLEAFLDAIIEKYITETTLINSNQKKFILSQSDQVVTWLINELVKLNMVKHNESCYNKTYSVKRSIVNEKLNTVHFASKLVPSSFDLTNTLPIVFDQGDEGSCTANAGATAVSVAVGSPYTILSRQYQYQNEKKLEGTSLYDDNGAQMISIGAAACLNGICEETMFPYISSNMTRTPPADAMANALNYKPSRNTSVQGLSAAKQVLSKLKLPVLVGLSIYSSFETQEVAKSGIVPMPTRGDTMLGGHAGMIVGYVDTPIKSSVFESMARLMGKSIPTKSTGYVIVRNSWGRDWGMNGYCHIPYEYIAAYGYDMFVIQK